MKLLNKYFFSIFLIIIIVFNTVICIAKPLQKYDNSEVEVRMPQKSSVDKLKNQKAFQYDNKIKKQNTYLGRIIFWFFRQFLKLFDNYGIAPFIRAIIMIGAVVFIVIMLLKTNLRSVFYKSRRRVKIEHSELEDDITKMNFNELIKKAEHNSNYRLAVRYLFLRTLKVMKEAELIDWKIDKTNNDYIVELKKEINKSDKTRKEFENLSSIYEHVWYGNFKTSNNNYQTYKNNFETFNY